MSVRAALCALTLLVLAACVDGGPLVGPGTVQVRLDSPNGDEGAAVLVLVGEGVIGTRSSGEAQAHSVTQGLSTRVVVIHEGGGTLEFEVDMVERGRPLGALIVEVAGPDDAIRADLSGYRVELSR